MKADFPHYPANHLDHFLFRHIKIRRSCLLRDYCSEMISLLSILYTFLKNPNNNTQLYVSSPVIFVCVLLMTVTNTLFHWGIAVYFLSMTSWTQ